jgi:hypothetical protein
MPKPKTITEMTDITTMTIKSLEFLSEGSWKLIMQVAHTLTTGVINIKIMNKMEGGRLGSAFVLALRLVDTTTQ